VCLSPFDLIVKVFVFSFTFQRPAVLCRTWKREEVQNFPPPDIRNYSFAIKLILRSQTNIIRKNIFRLKKYKNH